MKNNITKEIVVSSSIIILAVLLLNPMHFWMPDALVMCMLAIVLVLFGFFASFVLKEKVYDERDLVNRSLAGRNAFVVGSGVLMLGIVFQGYGHVVDPWLVVSLILMILAKIGTRCWKDRDLE
jgi:hypothetical protein